MKVLTNDSDAKPIVRFVSELSIKRSAKEKTLLFVNLEIPFCGDKATQMLDGTALAWHDERIALNVKDTNGNGPRKCQSFYLSSHVSILITGLMQFRPLVFLFFSDLTDKPLYWSTTANKVEVFQPARLSCSRSRIAQVWQPFQCQSV